MTWSAYTGPMSMTEGLNPFCKGIVAILKHDPEGAVVVVTDGDDAFDYETNANVLAAAPDLLAAASEVVRHVYAEPFSEEHVVTTLRAAIKKARGES